MKKFIIFLVVILIIIATVSYIYLNYKVSYDIAKKENYQFESYYNQELFGPDVATVINKAVDKINERRAKGKEFSIVVVAEGAAPKGGEITVEGTRDNGAGVDNNKLGGVGQVVARQLEKLTGLEARNTTLGYMQRGGTPTAFDRVLSTKYGAKAMELALNGQFGVLAVLKNGKLDSVSLEDVVGRNTKIGAVSGNTAESNLRKVTMDDDLVKTARDIGICLGD